MSEWRCTLAGWSPDREVPATRERKTNKRAQHLACVTSEGDRTMHETPRPPFRSHRRGHRRVEALLLISMLLSFLQSTPTSALDISYQGGSDWTGGSWQGLAPGSFPDDVAGANVLINSGSGTFDVLVNYTQPTIHEYNAGTLVLGAGDRLEFSNGRSIGVHAIGPGAAVQNDGSMVFNTGGIGFTGVRVRNGGEIMGLGEMVLAGGGQAGGALLADGSVITQGATHTLRGYGDILDNTGGMVNYGSIIAQNLSGLAVERALRVDPDAGGFVNHNILAADAGGVLNLDDGVFTNHATIEARDGGRVQLRGGAVIVGGTLAAAGSGQFFINNTGGDLGASTANPVLRGVTIATGTEVVVQNGDGAVIENGLSLDGMFRLGTSAGASTQLVLAGGSQAVAGNGSVVLSSENGSRVLMATPGDTLTLGGGLTVQGQGQVLDQTGNAVNHGHLIADQNVSGNTRRLTIDPGVGGTVDNYGEMQAENGGTLRLSRGIFTNRLVGTIGVAAGSGLELSAGATLRNSGILGGVGQIDVRDGLYEAGGGRVSPGASPGLLTWLGDFDQGGVDELFIELAGTTPGTTYDVLEIINGDVVLDGILVIDLLNFTPGAGDSFEIVRISGGTLAAGAFSSVRVLDGGTFDVERTASGITLTHFQPVPVPEPAAWLLMMTGGLGLLLLHKRRRTT